MNFTDINQIINESKKMTVTGGGGVKLVVQTWGNSEGIPILFIHGFSQSHLSWLPQLKSVLADEFYLVSPDNRGHGNSEKPLDPILYQISEYWADDINAIIVALGLKKPVLVGWSFGGIITCDYLAKYGDSALSSINFVSAMNNLGTELAQLHNGPSFAKHSHSMTSNDLFTNINGAMELWKVATAKPLSPETFTMTVAWNMVVPPQVRAAMAARQVDHTETLKSIDVPVLISYGNTDSMVCPTASEYAASLVKHAQISVYDGVGHHPATEEPDRFNRELAAFIHFVSNPNSAKLS